MNPITPVALSPADPTWPAEATKRLGKNALRALCAVGPVTLLATRKTALFCSARTPGDAILRAHDTARRLRDEGVTVISGFQSPIEKECLNILLRGWQPIIICPARAIEGMRIPKDWREAMDANRLLLLSPFEQSPRRPTAESAALRNEFVAALSDEAIIVHASSGGETARIVKLLKRWEVPIISPGKTEDSLPQRSEAATSESVSNRDSDAVSTPASSRGTCREGADQW